MTQKEKLFYYLDRINNSTELKDEIYWKCGLEIWKPNELQDDLESLMEGGCKQNYELIPFASDGDGGVCVLVDNQYVSMIDSEGGAGYIAASVDDFINILLWYKYIPITKKVFDGFEEFIEDYQRDEYGSNTSELINDFLQSEHLDLDNRMVYEKFLKGVSLTPAFIIEPMDEEYEISENLFRFDEAEFNEENVNRLARIIHDYCIQENLLHLDKYAMARVVEYASRMAGDQTKISTLFNDLFEVIGEASTWARLSKSKIVTQNFIEKALNEQKERIKKYDTIYTRMIKDNDLLIDTSGQKVGELNGLTILTIGNYSFGKPSKITVNTYTGKRGIINIEREVEMSGSTHTKGVYILSGYLGELFAQDIPLCLTASICFEQLYNGVDGDSASSTELYGLLSSLSGIPIKQSIAVTGSVNQKGQIQPIGGVNEKIEGFFQICKMRGLDGSHGVMIPVQNINNLQLSDDVVDAVKNKKFHIYAVSTIEEGIEVLTGVPAGRKDKDGNFPAGTINYLAYEKLKKFAKICEK